jgi:hypothetical protein
MKFATSNKTCFNKLNWKRHIEYIIAELSSACFPVGSVTSLMKVSASELVLMISVSLCYKLNVTNGLKWNTDAWDLILEVMM